MKDSDAISRFLSKIELIPFHSCWEWNGTRLPKGYGVITSKGKKILAHRFSYEISRKQVIPNGMVICHRCDNPSCVRPDHLFIGTQKENIRDMIEKSRRVSLKGEDLKQHKLSEQSVREIRKRYSLGGIKQVDLAKEYLVSQMTISNVVNRKWWSQVW